MILKLILFSILLHCIDDFVLQSAFLANGKQKRWWRNQNISWWELCKNDYIVCLIIHGLEWALLTFLPILILEKSSWFILIIILCNSGIHSYVDNLKANKEKINLITDQVIHVCQILITYFIWWII